MAAMKFWIPLLLTLGIAAGSGCASGKKARARARDAYLAGKFQATQSLQNQNKDKQPPIAVQGPVLNTLVEWREEITLAEAIVEAKYQPATTPRTIVIIRNGQAQNVNPRQLLSGKINPILEPGDIVQLMR
jgi:hypothetical protein